ncbi:MAG: transposase [Bacteroidetes bacterium]|nr:transposase [Bacteroidota bacterium]
MASLKIYLNTQSQSIVREAYPLVIELLHQDVKVDISTPYPLPEKNFDSVLAKAVAHRDTLLSEEKIDEINNYLSRELDTLKTIINYYEGKQEPYTAADVVNHYYRKESNGEFEDYVIMLIRMQNRRGGKVGIYSNLLKQIELYNRKDTLFRREYRPFRFENITKLWMNNFFRYISGLQLSQSAKSSYIRAFKYICMSACKDGFLNNELFSKKRSVIEQSEDYDLNQDLILQIKNFDLEGDNALSLGRDIFLFCYYADCMPFSSVATLKKKDIYDGMIWYRQHRGNRQLLSIKITEPLNKLICKYNTGGEYVFPLLNDSVVGIEEQTRIQLLRYNRNLKKLSMLMKLNVVLNSNSMSKIVQKKSMDNSVMISVSFNGNMRVVKIPCPNGCNVEELVLMNLKKMMGCSLRG